MVHFTLNKFKKAGQLAFLAGFIFVLPSCGGGGGGSGGGGTQPVTYTYKSFSEIDAASQAFIDACDANSSTCTESNFATLANETLAAADFFISAHHLRESEGGNVCSYDSTTANYSLSVNGTDVRTSFSAGAQIGATSKYGAACTGADVSGRTHSLNDENISSSPLYTFPGALSGILDIDYENWGYTDSGLNEIVFQIKAFSQRNNSGVYWSGNQYVIGAVGDKNFGTSCNYQTSPKKCSSFLRDNSASADLFGYLEGFKTFNGDMPSSGTASYRSLSMSNGIFGVTNYMNFNLGSAFNNNECSQNNPSHASCHWITTFSISAEHFISVDYSSKTLSGTFSMQNHYSEGDKGSMILITNPSFDSYKNTLNNLVISATISGTSFSGTVSNDHFSGDITGFFYGPQAKEIGAIIRFEAEGVSGSTFASSGAAGVIMLNGGK